MTYEQSPTLGFHSSSTQIPLSGGESGTKSQKWIVDVPMRSFQGGARLRKGQSSLQVTIHN